MAVLVISYSRTDRDVVRQLVALLRAVLRDVERAVFWDEDLEPGEEWFEQMQRSIDEAGQLIVFWCSHSAKSKQVRREFRYAFERKKRVVPVLIGDCPMPSELASIHAIDLRDTVDHSRRNGSFKIPDAPRGSYFDIPDYPDVLAFDSIPVDDLDVWMKLVGRGDVAVQRAAFEARIARRFSHFLTPDPQGS